MNTYSQDSRLYRTDSGKKVFGVCAGLARHFEQPAWAIRLGVVIAFLYFPGAIALAYFLGLVLLPKR